MVSLLTEVTVQESVPRDSGTRGSGSQGSVRVARTVAVSDTRGISGFPAPQVVSRQRWRPTEGTFSIEKQLARQSGSRLLALVATVRALSLNQSEQAGLR